jgi:hypothetical protein
MTIEGFNIDLYYDICIKRTERGLKVNQRCMDLAFKCISQPQLCEYYFIDLINCIKIEKVVAQTLNK